MQFKRGRERESDAQKDFGYVIKDYIEDVVRAQMKENEKMFGLTEDGNPKTSAQNIVCYMDQAGAIPDIPDLLQLEFSRHRLVREVKRRCPYDQDVDAIDLKLEVSGPKEDLYYSTFPSLVKNIRRGNTFLRVYNYKKKKAEYYVGRKGLMKFFDLRLAFVSKQERNSLNLSNYGCDLHQEKNYILGPILKSIAQGDKIEVLKTLKANGENMQVSWSEETESWVIASKNVAMLARDKDDIASYKQGSDYGRYAFAQEMAHAWFGKINKMTKDQLRQLKKDMDGHTLIGEYIGSQEHQHLVKYSRVTIIFYAVVDNYSEETCWPCSQAWQFFKKYSFDVVQIHSLGVFDNYASLCNQVEQTFKDVAKSSIAQDEEGNVLYFVKRDKDGKESVLSLAKLKTLEYRLFRKMREKLRNFYTLEKGHSDKSYGRFQEITKRFVRESKQLMDDGQSDLPKPLDYYKNIFSCAFDFIEKNPKQIKVLHQEYVTFSENLLNYIGKMNATSKEKIDNSNFFFSDVLDIQNQIQYGQNAPKSKKKKAAATEEVRKVNNIEEEEKSYSPKAEIQIQNGDMKAPKVIFVVPLAAISCGKTHIWKQIKEVLIEQTKDGTTKSNWSFSSVSSDRIRGQETQKILDQGKKISKDNAFQKSKNTANKLYKQQLIDQIHDTESLKQNSTHVIFLDKNHPPDRGIQHITDLIDSEMPEGVQYLKLYLIPSIQNEKVGNYPFSYEFVAQCMHNGIKREKHETLDNSDVEKMIGIQLMFLNMNQKCWFNDSFLSEQGLSGFLTLPLTNEQFEAPEEFCAVLDDTIEDLPKHDILDRSNKNLINLIKEVKANAKLFSDHPTPVLQSSHIKRRFDHALNKSKNWNYKKPLVNKLENNLDTASLPEKSVRKVQFEDKPTNLAKNESRTILQKPNSNPVFLGISCENQIDKIKKLVRNAFNVLDEEIGLSKGNLKDLEQILSALAGGGQDSRWKKPASYHVTQLFIGGSKAKLQDDICKNYREQVQENLTMKAVVYVPGRILTAICFPKQPTENEFPHLTLMTGNKDWSPKLSNTVLKETCLNPVGFKLSYEETQDGVKESFVQFAGEVKINVSRNLTEKVDVYYIAFEKDMYVTLKGETKSFYN